MELPEEGDFFNRERWTKPIPHLDEIGEIKSPLYREHVKQAVSQSVEKGIVYTLVWGYPNGFTNVKTTSHEHNLQTALSRDLAQLVERVELLKRDPRSAVRTIAKLNETDGIGTASTSKVAYFFGLETSVGPCLIFDQQVVRALFRYDYPELLDLRYRMTIPGRKPTVVGDDVGKIVKHPPNYQAYLEGMMELERRIGRGAYVEDLERFIFWLGRNRNKRTPSGEPLGVNSS